MKLPRLPWFLLLLIVAPFALIFWSVSLEPALAYRSYKDRWVERLSAYRGSGAIPRDWNEDVGLRQFVSGEWVLGAMYHGSCAPGREGCFNASVILDSTGAIHTRDWSPCAGGITNILEFWKELEPAKDLAALYSSHPEWTLVQRFNSTATSKGSK